MISAHLFIFWRVDWGSLTEIYVSSFLKLYKLPLDKGIVIRIHVCCYKGSSMVDMHTKSFQVRLSQRREVLHPKSRIFKFLNILFYNVHILQYTVLCFFNLCPLRKFRRASVCLKLVCEFKRGRTNWHSCAMIAEREKDIISTKPFIPCVKIAFGHWKGVSQMEEPIHVCVGESFEKLWFLIWLNSKILMSVPNVSGPLFETDEFVPSYCAFIFFH